MRQAEKVGTFASGRRPCLEPPMKGEVLCWSKWIVLLTILTFVAWVGAIVGAADAKVYLDVFDRHGTDLAEFYALEREGMEGCSCLRAR